MRSSQRGGTGDLAPPIPGRRLRARSRSAPRSPSRSRPATHRLRARHRRRQDRRRQPLHIERRRENEARPLRRAPQGADQAGLVQARAQRRLAGGRGRRHGRRARHGAPTMGQRRCAARRRSLGPLRPSTPGRAGAGGLDRHAAEQGGAAERSRHHRRVSPRPERGLRAPPPGPPERRLRRAHSHTRASRSARPERAGAALHRRLAAPRAVLPRPSDRGDLRAAHR